MVIVSACLLGIKCRYDGKSRPDELLLSLVPDKLFIPVCPEQLGGLSTPRLPAEITEGDGVDVVVGRSTVSNSNNQDITAQFLNGAHETRRIARLFHADTAILKEMSPSCGVHCIKRGGIIHGGMGVTAALLKKDGIIIISSDSIEEEYVPDHRYRK